jgi:uncharacterized membrane protein
LINSKTKVKCGGEFDRYDLEANVGMYAFSRGLLVVEEHGAGKQLIRLRCQTRFSMFGSIPFIILAVLTLIAAFGDLLVAALILSAFLFVIGVAMLSDAARATRNLSRAFLQLSSTDIKKTDEANVDSAVNSEFAKPLVADAISTKRASNS